MSRRKGDMKTLPPKRRESKTDDGMVGYRRPPKEHQFKPGRSGNPRGRPKGSKNEATIWRDVLSKRIPIREGGKTRRANGKPLRLPSEKSLRFRP
jgi:hypothetical protein